MTKVISELKKLAWIEAVVPNIGGLAPTAEKAIRRGIRLTVQDVINANSENAGKDGKKKHVSK